MCTLKHHAIEVMALLLTRVGCASLYFRLQVLTDAVQHSPKQLADANFAAPLVSFRSLELAAHPVHEVMLSRCNSLMACRSRAYLHSLRVPLRRMWRLWSTDTVSQRKLQLLRLLAVVGLSVTCPFLQLS